MWVLVVQPFVIVVSQACVERFLWLLRLLHSLHLLYLPALSAFFHVLLLWCRRLQARALPLRAGSPGHKELSPQVKITEVYVEYTLKSSTTRALPSVWSFWMCAEDEPITLKEKACRSVCSRCQWVMIERRNPLSAVTQVTSKVKKFRDKTLKTNRVWGTPDRIGIVWVGDFPEERRIWLSHIEDDGEKKYGAESTNQEFWSEKRKL